MISYDGIGMLLESDFQLKFSKPLCSANYWRTTDDAHVSKLIELHSLKYKVINLSVDGGDF